MTNLEKFRQVFGLPKGIKPLPYMCDIMDCDDIRCSDCPFFEEGLGFWDKEYKDGDNNADSD